MSEPEQPVGAFPIISFLASTRKVMGSGLIPEFVGELRATVDAANKLTAVAARLAAMIDRLFGDGDAGEAEPIPVEGMGSGPRTRWLVWRVKRLAEQEYRANGLASVRGELDALGVTPRLRADADPRWRIEDVWPAAVAAGVEDVLLTELARIEGFHAVATGVEGPVIDWLKRAGQWVWDHREQIMAVVRILLLFLALI